MKCQNPFSGKNKKIIINLSSDEFAHREVTVNLPFATLAQKINYDSNI